MVTAGIHKARDVSGDFDGVLFAHLCVVAERDNSEYSVREDGSHDPFRA